ncbi:MAG TPA: right-handed parallel beta-helix repeat-containing protein [Candidatus Saccharimonadales bacterium]|nr:right-handed parallel beta-helix repeat-containing protein [Candidatus Saccharimonadales bacterium]
MVWTVASGIKKNARTKIVNFTMALAFMAASLSGVTPLFAQKAFAAGSKSVCASGCDSTTIQGAINLATSGDTINVAAGTYTENVTVNKAVSIMGAGAASTKIVATDGNSTPLTFSTSGATVSGFTITHDYTPAEKSAWNFNNNGVAFGQLTTGNTLENSTVSLSRNGIYINRSQNNIINNTITDNRTGINATNTIDGTNITGNTISDNWTLGFVYYDSGYSTNFNTVTMTGNTFDNNWYTQVEVKTAAGSSGTLDVTNNTFSDSPVTYTTSSDASLNEPGFAAQQPVELGGSATKPATAYPTLRIYSSGSVVLKHTPKTLRVGASEPYHTIQSAINDASDGDTIAVDAGTYNENVNINKSLTLDGAQAGTSATSGRAHQGGSESTVPGTNNYAATFAVNAPNVTIDGFDFGPSSDDPSAGPKGVDLGNSSGATVENSIFEHNQRGISLNGASNVTVKGNLFTHNNADPENNASIWGDNVSTININHNELDNASNTAINLATNSNHITIDSNNFQNNGNTAVIWGDNNVTFSNNTGSNFNGSGLFLTGSNTVNITGNNLSAGSTFNGVSISTASGSPSSNLTFTGNTITGFENGINIGSGALSDTLTAHNNNLSGNSGAGINAPTGASPVVDATSNWWGNASGPKDNTGSDGSSPDKNTSGTGSAAIGAVKYGPWCTDSACSADSSAVPGQPTGLHAKFQYDSTDVADGSYLSYTSKSGGNNLELLWTASSGLVTGYHILTTYPDGTTHTFYQGPNTNAWLATYDGFGQHGNGKYTFQVVGVNSNGNSTPSASFTLYYDNTKPTVAFTSPTPADNSYVNSNFTVGYTANDNVALKSVNVSLYDTDSSHSNHWVVTCYSNTSESGISDSGTCTVHIPANTPDGKYYLQVGAQDKALNWSVNSTRTIYIDRTAPNAPSITAPNNGQYFASTPINNAWTAVTTDVNGNTEAIDHYQVAYLYDDGHTFSGSTCSGTQINGHTVSGCRDASGTSRGHTPSLSEQGGVTIWVRAVDKAGNDSAWSSPVHYYYDTSVLSAPTLTAPTNGGSYNIYTHDFDFTWDPVTDPNHGPVTYEWESSLSNTTNSSGAFSSQLAHHAGLTSTSLPEGNSPENTYYWHVRAVDQYGKPGPWSSTWSVTVDNTTPAVPTNLSWKDSSNATISNGGYTNSYNGTASWQDSSSDVDHYIYKYWNNIASSPYNSEANAWTTTTSNTSLAGVFNQGEGTHYFCIEAVDAAGNTSACSATFAVTYDTTAPVVHITAPTGDTVRGTVTISGTVTDANPDHYYLVVKDSHGNVIAGPGTVNAANVSNYNWNTTGLNGTYTIDLEARDKADNKDAGSVATKTVTVDNMAPSTPSASPAGGTYTTSNEPLVSLSSSDNDTASPAIYYTTDGSTPDNTSTPYTGAFTISSSETVKAVAYDDAGNESGVMSESYTIINTPAPIVFSSTFSGNAFTAAFVQGGGNGPTTFATTTPGGNGGAGTNGGNNNGGQVLGDASGTSGTNTGNNDGTVSVKSASTNKNDNKNSSAFLGLGWWWLPVVVVLFGLFFALFRRADGTDKSA